MAEMPDSPVSTHREAFVVGSLDDVAVMYRSARLNDRRRARFRGSQQAVGEGGNASRRRQILA